MDSQEKDETYYPDSDNEDDLDTTDYEDNYSEVVEDSDVNELDDDELVDDNADEQDNAESSDCEIVEEDFEDEHLMKKSLRNSKMKTVEKEKQSVKRVDKDRPTANKVELMKSLKDGKEVQILPTSSKFQPKALKMMASNAQEANVTPSKLPLSKKFTKVNV